MHVWMTVLMDNANKMILLVHRTSIKLKIAMNVYKMETSVNLVGYHLYLIWINYLAQNHVWEVNYN